MAIKLIHNVFMPVWILSFGVLLLVFPPQGVGTSLSLFAVEVLVVPGLLLSPSSLKR